MPHAPKVEQKSFDWKVHHFNKKTGKLEKESHYVYHVVKGGNQWVERDGKKYNVDGSAFKAEEPVKTQQVAPPQPPVTTEALVEEKKPAKKSRKAKEVEGE